MKTIAQPSLKTRLMQEAWIGDAILTLFARSRILRDDGAVDGPKCARMTSNQFLATIGEPTKVEAQVGRIYADAGLTAAFAWIETNLVPAFDKQELKRIRLPATFASRQK